MKKKSNTIMAQVSIPMSIKEELKNISNELLESEGIYVSQGNLIGFLVDEYSKGKIRKTDLEAWIIK